MYWHPLNKTWRQRWTTSSTRKLSDGGKLGGKRPKKDENKGPPSTRRSLVLCGFSGAPGGTRTPAKAWFRKPPLYPTELRVHEIGSCNILHAPHRRGNDTRHTGIWHRPAAVCFKVGIALQPIPEIPCATKHPPAPFPANATWNGPHPPQNLLCAGISLRPAPFRRMIKPPIPIGIM